jgi:antitoxin ParD1/3/4
MTTLNLPLPDSLATFVNQEAARNGHGNSVKYLQALIRKAQREAAREEIEQKLIEGLDSRPSMEVTEESWAKKQAELIRRYRKSVRR